MDTQLRRSSSLPFEKSLSVLAHGDLRQPEGMDRVDAGLKALGMDHGNPYVGPR